MLERMWRNRMLLPCWWECKLIQPLWKTVWRFLRDLEIENKQQQANQARCSGSCLKSQHFGRPKQKNHLRPRQHNEACLYQK